MSPGTHLGAASPVTIIKTPSINKANNTMKKKVNNDAKAYIRTLAQLNQRNIDFAVKSVSRAETLTSKEALKKNVINLIAIDIKELITKLNNYSFKHNGKQLTLKTNNWQIINIEPSWRTKFLTIITSPTIAYLLLLLGVYGLFFELSNPGAVIPGVIGAIAMFIALYALQMLPINYAGIGLILLGLTFMAGEALIPSFGILGIGGIIAFVFGSLLLMDQSSVHFQIANSAIIFMAIVNIFFFIVIFKMVLNSHKQQLENSLTHLIGRAGKIINTKPLQVKIDGEIWSIICDKPLTKGMTVEVLAVEGIHLRVIKES
jgi:membrane-bound serine protease (ClpP class)